MLPEHPRFVVTVNDLVRVLDCITFAPTNAIDVVDFETHGQLWTNASGFFSFRVVFKRPDTLTGEVSYGRGRWWVLECGVAPDAVIKTAFLACKQIVEHELMEAFLVDGERLFDPHAPVRDILAKENQ